MDSVGSNGGDSDQVSVQARRFDSGGVPQGEEFQVNQFTTRDQAYPSVASDSEGGFVVAWLSNGSQGSDSDSDSVQMRTFGPAVPRPPMTFR